MICPSSYWKCQRVDEWQQRAVAGVKEQDIFYLYERFGAKVKRSRQSMMWSGPVWIIRKLYFGWKTIEIWMLLAWINRIAGCLRHEESWIETFTTSCSWFRAANNTWKENGWWRTRTTNEPAMGFPDTHHFSVCNICFEQRKYPWVQVKIKLNN